MIRPTSNFVLVKMPSRFQDEVVAPGGMVFKTNPATVEDTKSSVYWGEVVAVPLVAGCELMVGDRVYFHFNVALRPDLHLLNLPEGDFWRVRIENTYAFVRDGALRATRGWALVEPDERVTAQSGLLVGMDGNALRQTVRNETVGVLRHLGRPGAEAPLNVSEGDRVFFQKDCAWVNVFEGRPLYTMEQRFIFGKIGTDVG